MSRRLLLTLGMLAAGASVACSSRAGETPASPAVGGEVLVGLRSEPSGFERFGRVLHYDRSLHTARIELRPGLRVDDVVRALRSRPDVRYAEPNFLVEAASTPNDPRWGSQSFARLVQADLAYDLWQPNRQIVLGVVDTGVDYNHSDLTGIICRDASGAVVGWDFVNGDSDPNDDNGHGTLCAGIAAAHINNADGIAGVTGWNPSVPGSDQWVKVLPVKVLNSSGTGTAANVAAGIQYAADRGALVILTSFATGTFSQALADAVSYAQGLGALVVAAAGNAGSSNQHYPAALPGVLALAATDANDVLVSSSNWGTWVDAAGPGSGVYSTNRGGGYAYLTGTSAAAAHAAGAAAGILSALTSATATQAADFIANNTDPYTPYQGRELASGAGRVNVYESLAAATGGDPVPVAVGVNPATVSGGAGVVATVFLGAPAPSAGVVVSLSSSDTSAATVPSTVTVPGGSALANFNVTTSAVAVDAAVTLTATADGVSKDGMLNVLAPRVSYVDVLELAVTGGTGATMRVVLGSAAPANGMVVNLSSDTPSAAQVPATVLVPGGQTSLDVAVTTSPVAANTAVALSAVTFGPTGTDTFTVKAPIIYSWVLNPRTVQGGYSSTATLTLNGPAPTGGVLATVSSSKPSVAMVPSSFTVPAGSTSASVQVDTVPVTSSQTAQITVVASGYSRYDTLTIATPLAGLTFTPTSVYGSLNATGKVTLNAAAPAGGTVVNLSSTNPGVASVPSSVTVPAGATSKTFTITTTQVNVDTKVNITASIGSASITKPFTVLQLLKSLASSPTIFTGGATVKLTVTLNANAPAGGAVIDLTSTHPTVVPVPATLTVPAGSKTAFVNVVTSAVTSQVKPKITATLGLKAVSKVLTVNP